MRLWCSRMAPARWRNPGYQSARAIRPRGGSPGLHKRSAEGWGNGAGQRSFTLARARGDPLGKGRQEEKTRTVCWSHGALRICRYKRTVCNTVRATQMGPSPDGRDHGAGARPRSPSSKLSRTPCAHPPEFCVPQFSAGTMRRSLTLILVRVINTPNSTLASSTRLPPGCPCAIYRVLAATRFDTLDPMPLVFFYNCHDSLLALVCAAVCQANFSHPRSRFRRTCSHSLSWSSAAGTESAAHISTICRKVATRPQ